MAPSAIAQRRTHNLLLLQKLLNLRDGASPFTLVLDTLEQRGTQIVREFMIRAKISKTKIIFVSFRSRRLSPSDIFIRAHGKDLATLQHEINDHIKPAESGTESKVLLVFDTLQPLCARHPTHLASFLSSLLSPSTCIVATYHLDVPLCTAVTGAAAYAPSPLSTLLYLATAILHISHFGQRLAAKQSRDRSLPEPGFGLQEAKEGILIGRRPKETGNEAGIVVEMELRRKSGRGIKEVFFVVAKRRLTETKTEAVASAGQLRSQLASVMLLDDHVLFAPPRVVGGHEEASQEGAADSTFNMDLTEKQRRDREGVVLPYFDAQNGDGPGDGGRILYEMGREDDYDEDEDDEF